ncbi:hypothetical protein JMJ77_0005351 [Colletotrichum scovillei]|uniref:Uncharacterized protein n=1 Tax=Colletotrichum scovillei TaxID=1209932 RepID=A0A9P7UM30_9PEZI|nr:hypothetical protein JMJ77_0005351 [Colletotrichum scovillei]KAG7076568.1 hypothetical protein JMJ76_0013830 [Colletotrichum scovillei]KAG7083647.1 hypothetical protein JMJ78_0009091 [Colletotrichum scovillei]
MGPKVPLDGRLCLQPPGSATLVLASLVLLTTELAMQTSLGPFSELRFGHPYLYTTSRQSEASSYPNFGFASIAYSLASLRLTGLP